MVIESVDSYLKKGFEYRTRQINQWPFEEGVRVSMKKGEVKLASKLHLELLMQGLECVNEEKGALIRLFILDQYHELLSAPAQTKLLKNLHEKT